MTALSVYPNRLSVVKIAIEFFDGMSMKEIAAKYRKSYEDVQEIIRRACK
jgi:Mor family transcriptional regulator